MTALMDIGSEVGVRQIDHIMRGVHLRPAEDFHHVARFVIYRRIAARSAHLWALGINEYADVTAHLAHVPYYIYNTLARCMGSIHANYVHTGIEELADKVCITTAVANRSYDFGLFHISKV